MTQVEGDSSRPFACGHLKKNLTFCKKLKDQRDVPQAVKVGGRLERLMAAVHPGQEAGSGCRLGPPGQEEDLTLEE